MAPYITPEMASVDLYAVLEISSTASATEIQAAFRRLALQRHPDKDPHNPNATKAFQLLQLAYETLKDPVARRTYDRKHNEAADQHQDDQDQDSTDVLKRAVELLKGKISSLKELKEDLKIKHLGFLFKAQCLEERLKYFDYNYDEDAFFDQWFNTSDSIGHGDDRWMERTREQMRATRRAAREATASDLAKTKETMEYIEERIKRLRTQIPRLQGELKLYEIRIANGTWSTRPSEPSQTKQRKGKWSRQEQDRQAFEAQKRKEEERRQKQKEKSRKPRAASPSAPPQTEQCKEQEPRQPRQRRERLSPTQRAVKEQQAQREIQEIQAREVLLSKMLAKHAGLRRQVKACWREEMSETGELKAESKPQPVATNNESVS